ncbi:hypothetical protein CMZ84_15315 [Lysobacteraceae bacterium NML93-0399]|nr:hypothetical protein CMZ84_15315 [Xanthomonadaceae bacterium NML93-0399]
MHRLLSAALAVAFLGAAAPQVVDAQNARQARQEVAASMLVTGHVDVDRAGRVTAHVLDQSEKLPPYVVGLVDRAVPALRFEPVLVDGVAVLARARMSLRLAATPTGNGEMNLRIASAHFGDEYSEDDPSRVRSAQMTPPRYPPDIARMGGKGTVYLALRVGRDGTVEDVAAEQVNLTALGNARQMERIRGALAQAAIRAARDWTFVPPTEGELVGRDYWVMRLPVAYYLDQKDEAPYGQWSAYHPGERNTPDWAASLQPGFRPDTLAAGGAATPETSRFKLLTSFEG